MRNYMLRPAALLLLAGCATQAPLQVQVTPLGGEPQEAKAKTLYALPMNVLKVEVTYREVRYLPGPFGEYAEKYLGITDVIRQQRSTWQIREVSVTPHLEMDPGHFYTVNVIEGEFDPGILKYLEEREVIMDGTRPVREELAEPGMTRDVEQYLPFVDLGITGNFEERTETMYKTLVTDTSFVQVPVERSVVEQKSPSKKAEEAADFLLEVRSRRFEMLTGEYEVYPDGEAMDAAIRKLDQLEASYLSLFTGRTVTRTMKKSWFVIPESGPDISVYRLGMFSEQLGFVPPDLLEGAPVEVQIEPTGTTRGLENHFGMASGGQSENVLYYRLPDVVILKVKWNDQELLEQRLSLFQAGSMVTCPISQD
jgi:hypothetical protein